MPRDSLPIGLKGDYYRAQVPDTLDLAEHAAFGLNHFTSIISEENNYEMYWGVMNYRPGESLMRVMGHPGEDHFGGDFDDFNPPLMIFVPSVLQACQPKALEAMAMLRVASGSKQNLASEAKMVEMMISMLGEDGLYWVPKDESKPWLGPDEFRPHVNVHGIGRMLRAMIIWYQYTQDPAWKQRVDKMVDGIDRLMVVHTDDYAYFPILGWMDEEYFRSCYTKKGWRDTTEPTTEKGGEEGSLFNHQGHIPGALANWFLLTGNKRALRLSGELVRFLTKPKFWADIGTEYPSVVGAEHAHWNGHWHGHINTLRAVLEYAIATNDSRLKLFVRDGYEWARQSNLARIGFVGDGQGCGVGRLIGLAIKLTDAGVGNYWEDVDQYIRNHGIELQIVPDDVPYLRKLGEGKPQQVPGRDMTDVGAIEASIGGFSGACMISNAKKNVGLCCSTHGNMGIFYAWDSIVRYSDGVARVNLLLNRASPWIDVDSYIPYEGKVVLKNKTAKEAFVRIPLWVDRNAVASTVNGRTTPAEWFGSYLRFNNLGPDDSITIAFPMVERTERWTLMSGGETNYTCRFRGNTLIEMSPPLLQNPWLYHARAERYKSNKAPMKETTRYVTPLVLKW